MVTASRDRVLRWRAMPAGKGVIEILSSVFKLGGLFSHEDNLAIAPASWQCCSPMGKSICPIGVGLLSYPWEGYAKT